MRPNFAREHADFSLGIADAGLAPKATQYVSR
jgi:hypothetical protein